MTLKEELLEAGFNSSMFREWWHEQYQTTHPEDWEKPANMSPLRRVADASWNFYLHAEICNQSISGAQMRVAAGRCKYTLPDFADIADCLLDEKDDDGDGVNNERWVSVVT